MKFSNCHKPLALAAEIVLGTFLPGVSQADEPAAATTNQLSQRTFATPEAAIHALRSATTAGDQTALVELIHPNFQTPAMGNSMQETFDGQRFARERQPINPPGSNEVKSISLSVGTNQWTLPLSLVKVDGQWLFDTAADRDENISRQICEDELHAIGVCRAYVLAQKRHAGADAQGQYARKFSSAEGTEDGLFGQAAPVPVPGLFGPRLAASQTGLQDEPEGWRPQSYYGYYFKILTRQGPDAPGGEMDYLRHHQFTGGFALAAYPAHWDESGIMTFIVGQEGRVYQKNLGPATRQRIWKMKDYNPDETWAPVLEEGVGNAAED